MGRKATGRSTKVVRVPNDFDVDCALHLFYTVLPLMQDAYASLSTSPRNYMFAKFLKSVGDEWLKTSPIGGDGKT